MFRKNFSILYILLGIILLFVSCTLPERAGQQWGWESERKLDPTKEYERSLKTDYMEDGENDARNQWRVLNYMMRYLAKGKADNEGIGSQTQSFLDQMKSLNIISDSARIMNLYEMIFAEDDLLLHNENDTLNNFVHVELAQNRLPQVQQWGGFIHTGGLNEWGKLITRLGPLEYVRFDSETVEGVATDGLTYKAAENSLYEFEIIEVADGPTGKWDQPTDMLGDDLDAGPKGRVVDVHAIESLAKQMEHESEYNVPIDYPMLDLHNITVLKIPSPTMNVTLSDSTYYLNQWLSNRLIIDISGNLRDLPLVADSSVRLHHITVSYTVKKTRSEIEPIFSGKGSFDIDPATAMAGGYSIRLFSNSFVPVDTCLVDIKVISGGQLAIHKEIIATDKDNYPLEISLAGTANATSTGIPLFHIGPVENGQNLELFFLLNSLGHNSSREKFQATALVLLLEHNKRKGSVEGGEMSFIQWGTTTPDSKADYTTIPNIIGQYGNQCIAKIDLNSSLERDRFLENISIPKSAKPGKYILALEFYRTVDYLTGEVELIGYGTKTIQIK